jgi:TetR/AcrR family transcriptional regulator, transcriptional repressor for nem operon
MSGVKQFDQQEMLDRAMTVFWSRGYQASLIQDLIEATGINRGSLYATFGDKKRLSLAALDHQSTGSPAHSAQVVIAEIPRDHFPAA